MAGLLRISRAWSARPRSNTKKSRAPSGAEAPLVQTMNTAEASEIVSLMRYPPKGGRGVITEHYYDRFTPGSSGAKLATANEATGLFALIETGRGVANVDVIAGVSGVGGLRVGHVDLSVDLGISGTGTAPV